MEKKIKYNNRFFFAISRNYLMCDLVCINADFGKLHLPILRDMADVGFVWFWVFFQKKFVLVFSSFFFSQVLLLWWSFDLWSQRIITSVAGELAQPDILQVLIPFSTSVFILHSSTLTLFLYCLLVSDIWGDSASHAEHCIVCVSDSNTSVHF